MLWQEPKTSKFKNTCNTVQVSFIIVANDIFVSRSEQNKKLEEFGSEREGIVTELSEHDATYTELKKQREEKESIIKEEIAWVS